MAKIAIWKLVNQKKKDVRKAKVKEYKSNINKVALEKVWVNFKETSRKSYQKKIINEQSQLNTFRQQNSQNKIPYPNLIGGIAEETVVKIKSLKYGSFDWKTKIIFLIRETSSCS